MDSIEDYFSKSEIEDNSGEGRLFDKKGNIYELNAAQIFNFSASVKESVEKFYNSIKSALQQAVAEKALKASA